MTGVQAIGILIIRVWAASVIAVNLLSAISTLVMVSESDADADYVAFILGISLWPAVALAAWVAAPALARRIVPASAPDKVQIAMGVDEFVSAGSFLMGGYILVRASPELVAMLVNILGSFAMRQSDAPPDNIGYYDWQRVFAGGLTVIIAMFLTFRPREIARLFSSLRHAGLPKVDEAD